MRDGNTISSAFALYSQSQQKVLERCPRPLVRSRIYSYASSSSSQELVVNAIHYSDA
ncbi:hypothetical protein ACU8KH_04346 [Lachancea thermotolerans]